jgi:hypothetical protein
MDRDTAATFRGTASELREALRETLDHLAPDEDVMKAPGFKLERDRKAPTQKQKVRFILRSRRRKLRPRFACHSRRTTETEVRHLKMYVDSVLAELLQVHG